MVGRLVLVHEIGVRPSEEHPVERLKYMKLIETYEGVANFSNRAALIKDLGDKVVLHVELYDELGLNRVITLTNKSIHYAQDCAENWVTGVIH